VDIFKVTQLSGVVKSLGKKCAGFFGEQESIQNYDFCERTETFLAKLIWGWCTKKGGQNPSKLR